MKTKIDFGSEKTAALIAELFGFTGFEFVTLDTGAKKMERVFTWQASYRGERIGATAAIADATKFLMMASGAMMAYALDSGLKPNEAQDQFIRLWNKTHKGTDFEL